MLGHVGWYTTMETLALFPEDLAAIFRKVVPDLVVS